MIKQFFTFLKSFFPKKLTAWYVIWFLAGSYYLFIHWDEAIAFAPFNGNSLIFCVWIGMILKPFIEEIDTPWGKTKFKKTAQESQKAENYYEETLATKNEEANK